MKEEIKLTKKQENVLNFIKKYIAKYNYPPSIREICDGINLKSPATVFVHLNNLENKGIIKTANGKFRTIKLLVDNEFVKKDEYKSRIDKEIKYIEKGTYKDLYSIKSIDELLNILKGENNE